MTFNPSNFTKINSINSLYQFLTLYLSHPSCSLLTSLSLTLYLYPTFEDNKLSLHSLTAFLSSLTPLPLNNLSLNLPLNLDLFESTSFASLLYANLPRSLHTLTILPPMNFKQTLFNIYETKPDGRVQSHLVKRMPYNIREIRLLGEIVDSSKISRILQRWECKRAPTRVFLPEGDLKIERNCYRHQIIIGE